MNKAHPLKEKYISIFRFLHDYQNYFHNDQDNKIILFYFESDLLLQSTAREHGLMLQETIFFFYGNDYHLILSSPRYCYENGVLSEVKV